VSDASAEDQVRSLLMAYQEYQAEAEAIVQQLNLTQLTVQGLDRAVSAIEAMQSAVEGQDILVPIGSGSFIHAKLASKETVVLNVGSGVSIEKPAAQAVENLKVRRTEVAEGSKKLSEVLVKIEEEMAKIQSLMQKYQGGSEGVVQ